MMKKVIKDLFSEFDIQYIEELHELHNNLLFLPERIQIEKNRKKL